MAIFLGILLTIFLFNTNIFAAQLIPQFGITDEEIRMLVLRLRNEDINKAKHNQIVVNYQGHTTARDTKDNAKAPLFSTVDSSLLRKPTYEKYIALMDNYHFEVGKIEQSDNEERREIVDFIDAIFETRPWKILIEFLQKKKHPYAKDVPNFKRWIKQLWFDDYSRAKGVPDTSGFEHVFVGESKNGEIAGLHSWLRFYQLERNHTAELDYQGFIIKRFDILAMIRFIWKGAMKRTGGFFIGTSPEFEMALYTFCFLSRRGFKTCDFEIDGCPFSVTSYDMSQHNKVFVGTVYPSPGQLNEQCRNANRKQG
uniref:Endoribonuclease n=1 Tax=Panagrolaimus davidi TaxID=227884 RepID=A0A914P9I8_9BILA